MKRLPIDRRLLILTSVMAIPAELVALFGFYSYPIDVGYLPGTPWGWQALGLFGLWVHLPALIATETWPFLWPAVFITGYLELWLVTFAISVAVKFLLPLVRAKRMPHVDAD